MNLMRLAPCRIYIDELQNQALAEAYCDRIHAKAMAAKQDGSGSAEAAGLSGPGPNAKQPDSIYLQLIQVWKDMCTSVRSSAGCRLVFHVCWLVHCLWLALQLGKASPFGGPHTFVSTAGQGYSHAGVPESPMM
jgi:hypothetical protein